MIFISEMLS